MKNTYITYQSPIYSDHRVEFLLDENSFLHHDTLPALIFHSYTETFYCYYRHGILFSKKSPAMIKVDKNTPANGGVVYHFSYYHEKNELLETKRPLTDKDVKTLCAQLCTAAKRRRFLANSPRHKIDGPALITKNSTQHFLSHIYYQNNSLHREDGPAVLAWEKERLITEEWYLEGKML